MDESVYSLEGIEKKKEDLELFTSVFNVLNNYEGIEKTIQICNTDRNLVNLLVHENILGLMSNYKIKDSKRNQNLEIIYESFKESDILDSYLFNNFNNNISEINSIIRCGTTSYVLSKQEKYKHQLFSPKNIEFSKLLSKFSLQHQNYKTKMHLNQKLGLTNNFEDNYTIYYILMKKIIISFNNDVLDEKIKELIEKRKFIVEDFEKMYKLIKSKIKLYIKNLQDISKLIDKQKKNNISPKKNIEELKKLGKIITSNLDLSKSESKELKKKLKDINIQNKKLNDIYDYFSDLVQTIIKKKDLTYYSKVDIDKKYFNKFFKKFKL